MVTQRSADDTMRVRASFALLLGDSEAAGDSGDYASRCTVRTQQSPFTFSFLLENLRDSGSPFILSSAAVLLGP